MSSKATLHNGYVAVKEACTTSYKSATTKSLIFDLCVATLEFLNEEAELKRHSFQKFQTKLTDHTEDTAP
jgi:hypothetical protein